MSHYCLVDRDAAFAIALQDSLEARGHSSEIFQEPLRALAALTEFGADVLILDLGVADIGVRQLIDIFHGSPETRPLPIVGLSDRTDSAFVVKVLELGLTDLLPRSVPLEELVVRITRSGGQPTAELPLIQGRLAGRQLADFLEYIRHVGQSGVLRITSSGGTGRIDIRRGTLVAARFKNLRAQSAVIAMLAQESGKFRLERTNTEPAGDGSKPIDMQSVLLRTAWLADKLIEYEEWVPRSGHELQLVASQSLETLGSEADSLPLASVLEQAKKRTHVRLHELELELNAPPQELRLVLAMLCKLGSLKLKSIASSPSTQELKSNLGVEYSILALMERARQAGTSRTLSLLMLAEPGTWPHLKALFLSLREPPFDRLAAQLEAHDRASVVIPSEAGNLALHLHVLDPQKSGSLHAVISVCDGILLWLDQGADHAMLSDLVQRVRKDRSAIQGVVIATSPSATEWAQQTLASRPDWSISSHPPSRITSLLRHFFSHARTRASNTTGG